MKLAFTKLYTDIANNLIDQHAEAIREGYKAERKQLVRDAAIMLQLDESELDHAWDHVCEAE